MFRHYKCMLVACCRLCVGVVFSRPRPWYRAILGLVCISLSVFILLNNVIYPQVVKQLRFINLANEDDNVFAKNNIVPKKFVNPPKKQNHLRETVQRIITLLSNLKNKKLSNQNKTEQHYFQFSGEDDFGSVDRILFNLQGKFKLPSIKNLNRSQFHLFPFENDNKLQNDDRIINQMQYVPKQIVQARLVGKSIQWKQLFMDTHYSGRTSKTPVPNECPVYECYIVSGHSNLQTADIVVFHQSEPTIPPNYQRPPYQSWIFSSLESPIYVNFEITPFTSKINFTMTYRSDSTIVTPYFKYTPYNFADSFINITYPQPKRNYALGKTKKVAWFVSNCEKISPRLKYAETLAKYIEVDIYGACGNKTCSRSNKDCFNMLKKDYKFYLAFENSLCNDYISEKLFYNALSYDVLPIVMGGRINDYIRSAPPQSFLHVESFASTEKLASYLHMLDKNDKAYSAYFAWHGHGLLNTNTFSLCRLCMLAHEIDNLQPHYYDDFRSWWQTNQCSKILNTVIK